MIKNSALSVFLAAVCTLANQPASAATSWRQLEQLSAEQLLATRRSLAGREAARAHLLLAHKLAPAAGQAALDHIDEARLAFQWLPGSDEAAYAAAVQCYNWLMWGNLERGRQFCSVSADPALISPFAASHLMRARAVAAFREGRAAAAMEQVMLAIEYARRSGSPAQLGSALMNRGLMLYEHGLLDEALAAYNEASDLSRKVPDDDPLGTLLSFNLGLVHVAAGQHLQALVNLSVGLNWAVETQQHQRQLIAHTYLGLARLGMDQPQKAIDGLSPLLDNPPVPFTPDAVSNGLLVRAKAYLKIGQLALAQNDLDQALDVIGATDGNPHRVRQLDLAQADLLLAQGQDAAAKELLKRMLENSSGAGASEHLEALEKLAGIYERAGDFRQALELSRQLFVKRQQQVGENYESRLSMLQVATDMANRGRELSLAEQRGIAARASAKTDRYVRNGVLAASVLVCALIIVLLSHRSARLLSEARLQANLGLEEQVSERTAELSAQAEQTAKLQAQRAQLARELALAEKERAIGQLTQGITHDFNNVLMVLTRSAEELRRIASPQQLALLDEIEAAVDSGTGLTRSLLSYARMQPLHPQYLRLDFFTEELESLLQRTLGPRIALKTRLCPAAAVVDRSALSTALLNLVINARDAIADAGEVAVHVYPVTGGSPPMINIQVTDTGKGMSNEVLSRGTEPYYTTRRENGGTGLGLSMVAGFAQQSGGKLLLGNAPSQGARVTLQLPAAPLREQRMIEGDQVRQAVHEPASLHTAAATALLVEDHAGVAAVLTAGLTQLGFSVEHVDSAEDALQALQDSMRPVLLVADISLAGPMDGLRLARQFTHQFPDAGVVISTGSQQQYSGEFPLLLKPFRLAQLKGAVDSALNQAGSRRLAGPADPGIS